MKKDLSVFEQLEFSTTRIEALGSQGESWSGTGFFFNMSLSKEKSIPLIITNKHVVNNASQLLFFFSKADDEGNPIYDTPHRFAMTNMEIIVMHPDPEVDLCGIPFLQMVSVLRSANGNVFYRTFDNSQIPNQKELTELDAVEEIMMVGYPNGLWDSKHNMPIFRKGITATPVWLDHNGKKEFVIDAACYPGSSGSPILICNPGQYRDKHGNTYIGSTRLYLLGVLYAGPQLTVTGDIKVVNIPDAQFKPQSISHVPNNLGYIIRSERIHEMVDVVKRKFSM